MHTWLTSGLPAWCATQTQVIIEDVGRIRIIYLYMYQAGEMEAQ